ncbi:MAG: DUF1844 domain-containing protein [Planctomycetota bacterium]
MAEEKEQKKEKQAEEKPKIVVDDDWKAQAQAEKEKLAEQAEREGGRAGTPGPRELPPPTFATLVNSLAMQAMLALGGIQDPKTKRTIVDLDLAKHQIDTLCVLEEKTKGNLSEDEKKSLDQALYETRMAYVQMAQQLTGTGG